MRRFMMRGIMVLATLAIVCYGAERVQAATVNVFGDRFDLGVINNFYNTLPGDSSAIISGALDTHDLSNVDLLWAVQPADAYTAAELTTMANFLADGGRIAFMGEHGLFAPDENTRINAALSALGSNMLIVNDIVDPGFRNATVANGQILAHPLTAGVNTYTYAAFAPLTLGGTSQALMLGSALTTVMMGFENIGPGSIFLITDQNVWDQVNQTSSNDNAVMFANLLKADTGAPPVGAPVPEPGTWALMGTGLVGLLGYGWCKRYQIT